MPRRSHWSLLTLGACNLILIYFEPHRMHSQIDNGKFVDGQGYKFYAFSPLLPQANTLAPVIFLLKSKLRDTTY